MAIRKILYPMDLTGNAITNRIENEYITIGTDKYRAFTLNYAPFYADSLTIKERGKTTLLKAGTDYVVLYYYSELAKFTGGKQICGVVCITNTAIGTDLVVGYNTIGGHYANCASIIEQAIYDLDLDNRETYWQNVIDKPDLFQPTQHLHDIGDVYGLEFIIDCLIGLREAIIIGDNEVHTQIYNRITEAVNEFKSYHATHLANYANPHKVTAHQAGAYTQEEVDALVESLLEDLAALEPRFKVITDNITDVYSKIAAVNGTLASLSDRIGYVEQELSKYVTLLTPINQTLASLQGQIDNINTLIAALQAKDVNLQNQINALVTRANNNDTLNGTQNSRLDALESLTSNHETRLDTLESWKTTTNNTLVAYDTRLDNLESENTTQDNRLNALESWKTAQQTWDTNTANTINGLSTRINSLENSSSLATCGYTGPTSLQNGSIYGGERWYDTKVLAQYQINNINGNKLLEILGVSFNVVSNGPNVPTDAIARILINGNVVWEAIAKSAFTDQEYAGYGNNYNYTPVAANPAAFSGILPLPAGNVTVTFTLYRKGGWYGGFKLTGMRLFNYNNPFSKTI